MSLITLPVSNNSIYNIHKNENNIVSTPYIDKIKYIPKTISDEVNEAYTYFLQKVAIHKSKKSKPIIDLDPKNYEILSKSMLHMTQQRHFTGINSLNIRYWNDHKSLENWKRINIREWLHPVTGRISPEKRDKYIPIIFGDILTRTGVSGKYSPFEHWGIYMGNIGGDGVVLEIEKYEDDKAHISMTKIQDFIQNDINPVIVLSTIKQNNNGSYSDTREYTREITGWTSIQTITSHWIYSPYPWNDQTCQSYVNLLIYKKKYTTQLYTIIYPFFNTIGIIIVGQYITIKHLKELNKKGIKVCLTPCKLITISGKGKWKKNCICESECKKSLLSDKSWCYVNNKCGQKYGLNKYNGKFYAYCNKMNKQSMCKIYGDKWKKCVHRS